MNERIKELAEQAIGDVDYIRDDEFTNEELSKMYIPDCFAEKFARLIIQECIQTLRDNTPVVDEHDSVEDWDRGYIRGMVDCEHHIKEHFGVE